MLRATNIEYELAGRAVGTACGGIGLVHQFVRCLGLARAIDQRLHVFKIHLPYHESDHVLNLAYNALCGGTCLEDFVELHRQDEGYLNAFGTARIPIRPRPATFADDSRARTLQDLQAAFDVARLKVWAGQPPEFFACRAGSKPTARWSKRRPNANRASTSRTKAFGAIIRWCSRWPIRAKCCGC